MASWLSLMRAAVLLGTCCTALSEAAEPTLAEVTPAAATVALASLLWPLACGLQLVQAWRHWRAGRGAGWEAGVAPAGLQLSVLLGAFGWLPRVPWRL